MSSEASSAKASLATGGGLANTKSFKAKEGTSKPDCVTRGGVDAFDIPLMKNEKSMSDWWKSLGKRSSGCCEVSARSCGRISVADSSDDDGDGRVCALADRFLA
jgi:hypothetical protein